MWIRANIFITVAIFFLQSCGSSGASPSASPAIDESRNQSERESDFKTAIFIAADATPPECTRSLESQIAYFSSERKFRYCNGLRWWEVDLRGPQGEPGIASTTEPNLISKNQEAPGANCFYGGNKYTLWIDKNKNLSLDPEEIGSSFFDCESSISLSGSKLFDSYLYSVGLVTATYRYTGTCLGSYKTHERSSSGTAWAYSDDTFVTNAHVLRKSRSVDCNSDGSSETTFILSEVKLHLPKKSISSEIWRSRGPTYNVTSSQQTDYDTFWVTQLDRRPSLATSPSLPMDISDAVFMRVLGHGSLALPVTTSSQDILTSNSLRIGEQIFLIGHPGGRSLTMSLGELMSIQSCHEWWYTDPSILSIFLTPTTFCNMLYSVPDSRRMIISNYMDHGSSGGPAFNRFGEVVGMLTWGSIPDEESDYGALLQISYVRKWLIMPRVWTDLTN